MDDYSDLSDLERVRLENIRKNAEFLAAIGLEAARAPLNTHLASKTIEKKPSLKRKSVDRTSSNSSSSVGLRRSSRLKGESGESVVQPQPEEVVEEAKDPLTTIPVDSDGLDDYEFEVFAALKKWRLSRCRELEIEPYKIFQNRTLCEIVRRRRNDPNWARLYIENTKQIDVDSGCAAEVKESDREEENASDMNVKDISDNFTRVCEDLLMCWGIGQSKVKKDGGFAHEAIAVLDSRDDLAELLVKSVQNFRKLDD